MTNTSFVDPVPSATKEALARALPPSARIETHYPIVASASQDLAYWLSVIMEAPLWAKLLPVAAPFLARLSQNAADDLWKNKHRIGPILREAAHGALLDVAVAVAIANDEVRGGGVHVGLPLDDHWGAHTSLAYRTPEEVSVCLARFVVVAERAEVVIRANAERYPRMGPVRIETNPEHKITVWWNTTDAKGTVWFALKSLDGEFEED